MTEKQREYMILYEKGYGVCEIARMTGKAKTTISATLKAAKQPKKDKRAESIPCPYSSSCFTCPKADCVMRGANYNLLPVGYNYLPG